MRSVTTYGFPSRDARQIFQNCLEVATCDESCDCKCDLVQGCGEDGDDALRLEFTMTLRVFSVVWTPVCGFDLRPIPLEPIQIAEAKLRDERAENSRLEIALQTMREELKRARGEEPNAESLVLECDGEMYKLDRCFRPRWKVFGGAGDDDRSDSFDIHLHQAIRFRFSGSVAVVLQIKHRQQASNDSVFAMTHYKKSGVKKKTWKIRNYGTASLHSGVILVEPDEKLEVWIRGEIVVRPDTTLVILPL